MMLLTRRELVYAMAGCLAGSPAFLNAAEPDASVPFGFSLYGMKALKVEDALRTCSEIGYDGVELVLMPGWATEPKLLSQEDRRDLAKRLVDAKLGLLGLMENLHEPADAAAHRANLDRLKAAAELGHALSPKAPPVIETVLGNKPAQWNDAKDRLVERLRAWAEVGAASRTVIAVKPHVANALHTPEAAAWLLQQVKSPWLKLAFDFSHFVLRGLDLAKTVAALVPDSAFIHVKDAKGTPDKFQFLLPGDGNFDYVEYFKLLRAAKYRGPIVVEVSGQLSGQRDYDAVAAARRCHASLAPALKKAELRT